MASHIMLTGKYVLWPLTLGLGAMRAALGAVLWRAVALAASFLLVISHRAVGLMVVLCASVIAITAWYYPVLLARTFATRCQAAEVRE